MKKINIIPTVIVVTMLMIAGFKEGLEIVFEKTKLSEIASSALWASSQ